ncbi:hypothetical protein CVU82_02230 [Candidatus Falkowbacteria bacterium HGW-Falkowbacteria-1]|jgi:capsular polysaccharide biosynthesis protein|uniref:Polysaccharide chain length determinant N-terminal domain-containing protein n=1 Tax=Candidatus Falkowbacteria bacterium HGW-Falkowbacteria-1 TaxID=2013768 RepID=A0A2N2E9N5_9BACT|nr:MAG: hypothetical protein CVU82_02230 [Candidatus Falkowbacteria bacterium HGW-Falkowbacteria-1]
MELSNLLKQKRQTLLSIFLMFLLLGAIFTLLQDFKFGAKSQILVIQEGYGRVDPFAVSRSVEYLSDLFSRVVYSNSFFSLVLDSGFDIDRSYFGEDSTKQMKKWKKTLSAKSVENSGIINISIYHPDAYQAKQIALAVNSVLMTKNQNYQGLGDSVKISILDQPVVSKYPVKPNLIFNGLFLIGLSLFFGLVYIYVFPEEKYSINLSRKRRSKKMDTTKGLERKTELKNEVGGNEDGEIDSDVDDSGSINNILE